MFDSKTKMVLVNALFFEKKWAHPFVNDSGHRCPFYFAPDVTKEV